MHLRQYIDQCIIYNSYILEYTLGKLIFAHAYKDIIAEGKMSNMIIFK